MLNAFRTVDWVLVKRELEKMGHECFVSGFADDYVGKSENEIEKLNCSISLKKMPYGISGRKLRKVTPYWFLTMTGKASRIT